MYDFEFEFTIKSNDANALNRVIASIVNQTPHPACKCVPNQAPDTKNSTVSETPAPEAEQSEPVAPPITDDETDAQIIRALLAKVQELGKLEAARALLQSLGATRVSDLPKGKVETLIEGLKELVGEA